MKTVKYIVIATLLLCITLSTLLSGCDLARKLQGVELKFQKKVSNATQLSFSMDLTIEENGQTSKLAVNCYKNDTEYAYTFADPDSPSVVYRKLYADGKLYEFVTKTNLHLGTYYITHDVDYTAQDNLLYWVTQNILAATYATLLTESVQEQWGDTTVYRYDFAYRDNTYNLWYDDANLVGLKATFVSYADNGDTLTEVYSARFADYHFENVDRAPFYRPNEGTDIVYVESRISFETWMEILDRFSRKASVWMQ